MSRSVWALVPGTVTGHMEWTSEPDPKQWIFTMIRSQNHEELTRCFLTLWAIWFARWKAIHENVFQNPLSTHMFVESMMRDLELTVTRSTKKSAPVKNVELMRPKRIYFPEHFRYCFASNLCILDTTNTD
jgi:hypothetical protein